mmetsp:Transcript_10700/g.21291  ORF Transcript_10700/g.21291 Transcript_10700/m.21291 type:complete len:200 (-) Transcript_10700:2262-2861(-)
MPPNGGVVAIYIPLLQSPESPRPGCLFPAEKTTVLVHESRKATAVPVQCPFLAFAVVGCVEVGGGPASASLSSLKKKAVLLRVAQTRPFLHERTHGPGLDGRPPYGPIRRGLVPGCDAAPVRACRLACVLPPDADRARLPLELHRPSGGRLGAFEAQPDGGVDECEAEAGEGVVAGFNRLAPRIHVVRDRKLIEWRRWW